MLVFVVALQSSRLFNTNMHCVVCVPLLQISGAMHAASHPCVTGLSSACMQQLLVAAFLLHGLLQQAFLNQMLKHE